MVLLREQMTKDGTPFAGGTENSSTFQVRVVLTADDKPPERIGTVLGTDPGSASWMVDISSKINPYDDETEWIKDAFTSILRSGVTSEERMRRVGIVVEKADIKTENPETSWRDITQPMLEAARKSIRSGDPVVLEPWIHLEISSPEEYVGTVSSILAKRKGHVFEIDSERSLYRIVAEIPVSESFGLATEIRSSTSGWVTWGAEKGGYRDVKDSERRFD
jgi:elongation factor 2